MGMPGGADDDEFDDFMSRVNDVSSQIDLLKDGKYDFSAADKEQEKIEAKTKAAAARKQKKQDDAEAAVRKRTEELRKHEQLKEENKEKVEELKKDYYLRKARREKWEAFRAEQQSKAGRGAFTDYYRGWSLFEEDPDEDLFSGDKPAAVQDQAAFDAMSKDIEERTATRKGAQKAAEKERERGNAAFKAGQVSEALAAYSCGIEHCRTDKALFANRALAHLKLRNWLSAVEDASRVLDISQFHDDDFNRRPVPTTVVKAFMRRAAARGELEQFDEAEAAKT